MDILSSNLVVSIWMEQPVMGQVITGVTLSLVLQGHATSLTLIPEAIPWSMLLWKHHLIQMTGDLF